MTDGTGRSVPIAGSIRPRAGTATLFGSDRNVFESGRPEALQIRRGGFTFSGTTTSRLAKPWLWYYASREP